MINTIFGYSWEDILAMQRKTYRPKPIDVRQAGDCGADPLGDGTFRMVPSGDVVGLEERNSRLNRA